MVLIHWLGQDWNVGIASLPGWAWALTIAAIAAAAACAVYASLAARGRWREADRDMTEAFAAEYRKDPGLHAELLEAPPPGSAREDDWYSARPPITRPGRPPFAVDRAPAPGSDRPGEGGPGEATAARFSLSFRAWLDHDRAEYRTAVDRIDRVLKSGAWASTPWLDYRRAA